MYEEEMKGTYEWVKAGERAWLGVEEVPRAPEYVWAGSALSRPDTR